MADDTPRFRIRRVPKDEPRQPPPEASPEPATPEPDDAPHSVSPDSVSPEGATGGLFTSPSGVLSFLAAVAGSRLADEAICRRAPQDRDDGAEWWADVDVAWESVAPYVRTAGGRPFESIGTRWLEVPILGAPTDASRNTADVTDVRDWPLVDLAELLTTLPLRRIRPTASPVLDVVVPGALGGWVLGRATALGLGVRMATAKRLPLRAEGSAPDPAPSPPGKSRRQGTKSGQGERVGVRGSGEASSGVLLIRLQADRGTIPLSLVEALSNLPYTVVGRPVGPSTERLLVDARYQPPLTEALLGRMIPAGETWLLGGPDVGHSRLTLTGELVDGADLLTATPVHVTEAASTDEARLPSPLEVRLISRRGPSGPTDALLLDDDELGWLQRFLMTRPTGERAFLIPGGERHLLTAPGGLTGTLPFGVPLRRTGPGGLYVETGLDFFPPLPPGARRDVFGLADDAVVAVASDGAVRFPIERMVPAWTLWVGEAPEVRVELSEASRELLGRLSVLLSQREVPPPSERPAKPLTQEDRSRLLEEAQRAEMRNDLVGAAERLEKAGELGAAGRLYERAAMAS